MALDFFAGFVGGCAGVVVGHPLDTVKVKLQVQDYKNPLYRGTWDCFSKIIKKESVAGLYRGLSSPMAGVAVVNAIVFGVQGNVQRSFMDQDSLQSHFLSGATAGLIQSVVTSPVELLKTRVQISNRYAGVVDCFVKTMQREGLRGMFKGLGVTAVREFLGCGLLFTSYEALTNTTEGSAPPSTAAMMLAGGVSGTISWIFTYPLDVIKSRYQADVGRYYTGVFDCLRKSVAEEGLAILTRGLTATLIKSFPTNAVTFAVVAWVFQLAEFGVNKKENIQKRIGSMLETQTLNNKISLIGGTINNVQLGRMYWKQTKSTQRLFSTAGDFWVDGLDDYFEEATNSNVDQMKNFERANNLTNDNLFIIDLNIIKNPVYQDECNNLSNMAGVSNEKNIDVPR